MIRHILDYLHLFCSFKYLSYHIEFRVTITSKAWCGRDHETVIPIKDLLKLPTASLASAHCWLKTTQKPHEKPDGEGCWLNITLSKQKKSSQGCVPTPGLPRLVSHHPVLTPGTRDSYVHCRDSYVAPSSPLLIHFIYHCLCLSRVFPFVQFGKKYEKHYELFLIPFSFFDIFVQAYS